MFATVPRTAVISWSPRGSSAILATASLAGSLGADFDATARLEFFSPDSPSTPITSVELPERSRALAWGTNLVAVALEGGSLQLWDASSLLSSQRDSVTPVNVSHEGSILSLDFNVGQEGLLASGGNGGEVLVWDTTQSVPRPYAPGPRPSSNHAISAVAWNPKVARILAAAGGQSVAVWDLRAQRAVAQLSDRRCPLASAVAWHPETPTLLATASGDDRSPSVLLWDLRAAQQPLAVLDSHRHSVRSLSWSPHCAGLLLSVAADGRALLWNANDPRSAALASECEGAFGDAIAASWAPNAPALAAVAAADGPVRLVSTHDPLSFSNSPRSLSAPNWLKRRAGVTLGGGGRLVRWGAGGVLLSAFSAQPQLVADARLLETALSSQSAALQYCADHLRSASSDESREQWSLLSASVASHQSPLAIIEALGLCPSALRAAVDSLPAVQAEKPNEEQREEEKEEENERQQIEAQIEAQPSKPTGVAGFFDTDDSEDVFAQLNSSAAVDFPDFLSNTADSSAAAATNSPAPLSAVNPLPLHSKDPIEDVLIWAVLSANWPLAVDACERTARWADALAFASLAPPPLLSQTTARYLSAIAPRSAAVATAAAVQRLHSEQDSLTALQSVSASAAAAGDWKRALALAAAHAQQPLHFTQTAGSLVPRLLSAGHLHAATCAAIAAGDAEALADLDLHASNATDRASAITAAVQRAAILSPPPATGRLQSIYAEYADLIARAGALSAAQRFAAPGAIPSSVPSLSSSSHLPASFHSFQSSSGESQSDFQLSQSNYAFEQTQPTFQPSDASQFQSAAAFQHPSNAFQPPTSNAFQQPQAAFQPPPSNAFQPPPAAAAAAATFQPPPSNAFQPPQAAATFQPPQTTFQPSVQTSNTQQAQTSGATNGPVRREAAASFNCESLRRIVEFASQLPVERQTKYLSDFVKRLSEVDTRAASNPALSASLDSLASALSGADLTATNAAFQNLTVNLAESVGSGGVVAFRRLRDASRPQ